MSFDSDHKQLKNSDIYLGAFSEMVAAFHHLVNVVKAAEYDGDSDAADADSDSDAAAESDGSTPFYHLADQHMLPRPELYKR